MWSIPAFYNRYIDFVIIKSGGRLSYRFVQVISLFFKQFCPIVCLSLSFDYSINPSCLHLNYNTCWLYIACKFSKIFLLRMVALGFRGSFFLVCLSYIYVYLLIFMLIVHILFEFILKFEPNYFVFFWFFSGKFCDVCFAILNNAFIDDDEPYSIDPCV